MPRLAELYGRMNRDVLDSREVAGGLGLPSKYCSNMLGKLFLRGYLSREDSFGKRRGVYHLYRLSRRGLMRVNYLKQRHPLMGPLTLAGRGTFKEAAMDRVSRKHLERIGLIPEIQDEFSPLFRRHSIYVPFITVNPKLIPKAKTIEYMLTNKDVIEKPTMRLLLWAKALQDDGVITKNINLFGYVNLALSRSNTQLEILTSLLYKSARELKK